MAENLRTTKYNDSTSIPLVTDEVMWYSLKTPGYCWYNNDLYYKTDYGALYNWYAVSTGKLCPAGWHVPSLIDCSTLLTSLGGEAQADLKLTEIGTSHWKYHNDGVTNESGFTALPAGGRFGGGFTDIGINAYFWVYEENSSKYWCFYIFQLESSGGVAITSQFFEKQDGNSVRCVKD
jgi:uncharacterized protein (TIGR02145 family)